MTDARATSERLARAHAVCQSSVDDARGSLHEIVAEALAAGIECLRGADGKLDSVEVREFLEGEHAGDIADIAPEIVGASNQDLGARLLDEIEGIYEIEDSLARVIGVVEPLGGYDSTGFGMMTTGRMTTWAIRRGNQYLTFATGDDCGDQYSLYLGGSLVDDPELRHARLALADELGGLGPGVWIEGEEELSDELRDLTIPNGGQWPDCWQVAMSYENLVELIEENVEPFAASRQLSLGEARDRLAVLFDSGEPDGDLERDLLWEIWTSIRPT